MTEYEITKAVLDKLGYYRIEDYYAEHKCFFDPCNNAQQAWEIMLDNNISITKDGEWYFAFNAFDFTMGHMEYYPAHKRNIHEKPFVAAMLLFLEI